MVLSGMSPGRSGGIGPFIAAFLIGTVAIVLCRRLLPGLQVSQDLQVSQVWADGISTLVAVTAIVILGVHYHLRRRAGDMRRSGDDLYYLGLLFTLVSLIYALVVLFLIDEGDANIADRTHNLIGSFGIALFSTVAGILGRIILQGTENGEERSSGGEAGPDVRASWSPVRPVRRTATRSPGPPVRPGLMSWAGRGREGSDGPMRREDLELARLARRLRAELRGASDAFSHYNRMTLLQAEDTKRHAQRVVEEFTRELRENARSAIVESESAYRKLGNQIHATGDELVGRVEQVTGALAPLAEAVGSATQAVAGFPADIQQARRGISALADAAQVVAGSLDGKAGDVARASETLARNARQHQEIVEQNLQRARAMGERMDSGVSDWARHAERAREAFAALDEIAGTLTPLAEQMSSAARAVAGFPDGMVETQRSMEALADTAQAVAGRLDDGAEGVTRAGDALVRNAREQREIMEQNLERARAVGARMDSEVSEWSQSEERIRTAFRVAGEMAGALETLVEQVESASRTLAEFSGRLEATRPPTGARDGALEAVVSPGNGGTSWRTVFRDELRRQLALAEMEGKPYIAVSAESLHRELGDSPDSGERMRECCEVMYGEMGNDDRVDTTPHDRPGATLAIRYVLPRPSVA